MVQPATERKRHHALTTQKHPTELAPGSGLIAAYRFDAQRNLRELPGRLNISTNL
jgi:hypothetical protein